MPDRCDAASSPVIGKAMHYICRFAFVASVAALIAACALWARSYGRSTGFFYATKTDDRTTAAWWAITADGRFRIGRTIWVYRKNGLDEMMFRPMLGFSRTDLA